MGYHGMYREQYMGVSENGMYVYIYTHRYTFQTAILNRETAY